MNRIRAHSLGLAFCVFLAVGHTLWAFLVWIGAAQWLIDFVFRLHMITPPYKIADFKFNYAIGLILLTGIAGYVFGFLLGAIWNAAAGKVEKS
jgi:hypothetical protein